MFCYTCVYIVLVLGSQCHYRCMHILYKNVNKEYLYFYTLKETETFTHTCTEVDILNLETEGMFPITMIYRITPDPHYLAIW